MTATIKKYIFPGFPLITGVVGFFLRYWLFTAERDGLLPGNHIAGGLLLALLAVVLAVCLWLVRRMEPSEDYPAMFPRSPVGGVGIALGAVGMGCTVFAVEAMGVLGLLLPVLAVVGTGALLLGAFSRFRGERPHCLSYGLFALYLIIYTLSCCRIWGSEPQLQMYLFPLLALLFLMIACYYRAELTVQMKNCRRYVFFSQVALFCCCVSVQGTGWPFYLSGAVLLAADSCCLPFCKKEKQLEETEKQQKKEEREKRKQEKLQKKEEEKKQKQEQKQKQEDEKQQKQAQIEKQEQENRQKKEEERQKQEAEKIQKQEEKQKQEEEKRQQKQQKQEDKQKQKEEKKQKREEEKKLKQQQKLGKKQPKMPLPWAVGLCMETLERAGFEVYAVGGCVRDSLLGLCPHDYDLCTNARPEEMAALFAEHTLVRSGEKHGTIGVVVDSQVVEITTYRTEGGYQDSRHPDWVEFVSCLQEDLARRDFTVNAMAYHPRTGYVDLFGGLQDLKNGILRTVGDPRERFTEDALRILRGVRFGVRFGLKPEDATLQAMKELAPSMEKLAKERVFDELSKLLPLVSTEDLLLYKDIFVQVLPALAPSVDFDQHSEHHRYDVYTHTAHVVGAMPPSLAMRWAALLHDCGKPGTFQLDEEGKGHFYGHAELSAKMAEETLLELKAPTALRKQACFLIAHHMTPIQPDKRQLHRLLAEHSEESLRQLLVLQRADIMGKGTGDASGFQEIFRLLEEVLSEANCLSLKNLAVNGKDLLELGFEPGPELGECLNRLLEQVQNEELPNEKEALLAAAKECL